MKKRWMGVLLAFVTAVVFTACGGTGMGAGQNVPAGPEEGYAAAPDESDPSASAGGTESGKETEAPDFRIGIVTGSYSQSEDDRRGAEAFQEKYGEDSVTLAIYPDNFTEELETTIQIIAGLADDPAMKAIIVNQAVDGTAEAFRRIHEKRPDIICIAGEAYEDFTDISMTADLVVNCDFVNRGYLIIHTAHELGCDTFVHISFPRHLSYETVARRVAIMEAACEEFGMNFVMEEAPDPTTEVGVPGAQAYITEHVPGWLAEYGEHSAYFCTNDAHTEPLIRSLLEQGGYFIEADLPSPLMGYPGALDLDLTSEGGDYKAIMEKVEQAVVEGGGAGRFGTWTCSYGYTLSSGLAEHARNVILGESELKDLNALFQAYGVFSPGVEWNGSRYTDSVTGTVMDNTFLVYQDTYIFGDPGYYMGSTGIEVPEVYYTLQ